MASRKYVRKDGTAVITTPCTCDALRKHGILKVVCVIPPGMHRNVADTLLNVFPEEIKKILSEGKK